MKYILYGNGSSGNHGCEAIVRGTVQLLRLNPTQVRIQSMNPQEDIFYGLDKLGKIFPARSVAKRNYRFWNAYVQLKLLGQYTALDGLQYLSGIHEASEFCDIALSLGGDNYCYSNTELYAYLNRAYRKQGIRTVLWGCSIEPDVVAKRSVAKDLARYNLIVARDSITFHAIKNVQENVILSPDPAFFMGTKPCALDPRFDATNVIGINVSPMIIDCEKHSGITYENYSELIHYILSDTDAMIALIPHVVWPSNDDRKVLQQLYDDFKHDSRIIFVEDHSAPELKFIISQCCFFIGARTHASIAAYSSCIPTLVVGYSVKARGIARDIFGDEEDYIIPVQSMHSPKQLTEAFITLYARRENIKQNLDKKICSYKNEQQSLLTSINQL